MTDPDTATITVPVGSATTVTISARLPIIELIDAYYWVIDRDDEVDEWAIARCEGGRFWIVNQEIKPRAISGPIYPPARPATADADPPSNSQSPEGEAP